MLPFIMGMQCQNVVNMLPMTLKYVVECKRSLLMMVGFFCKRFLFGLKKWQMYTKMHPSSFWVSLDFE